MQRCKNSSTKTKSEKGLKLDFAFRQKAELLNGGLLPCAANHAESVHDEGRVENECDDGKNDAKYLPDPGRDLDSSRPGDARSEDHLEESAAIERETWSQIVEH